MDDLGQAFLTAVAAGGIALLVGLIMVAARGIVGAATDRSRVIDALREARAALRADPATPETDDLDPAQLVDDVARRADPLQPLAPHLDRTRRWRNSGAAVFSVSLVGVLVVALLPALGRAPSPPSPTPRFQQALVTRPAVPVPDRWMVSEPELVPSDPATPPPTAAPTPRPTPRATSAVRTAAEKTDARADATSRPAQQDRSTPRPTPAPTAEPTPTPPPPPAADPPQLRFSARDPQFPGDDADFYGRCIHCERWTINFGDGQSASGDVNRSWIRSAHVYEARGEYTVTLTVYGPGGEASDQDLVRVWFD